MILGYLAYVIVFIAGFFTCALVAGAKIENLERHIEQLQSAIIRLTSIKPATFETDGQDW